MKVCAMCAIRPQWHTWHTLALALALALAVLVLAVLVLAVCWHTRHTPWCCAALVLRGQRPARPAASALLLRPGSAEAGVAGPSG